MAIVLTASWVVGAAAYIFMNWAATSGMTANEWGDFFAGVFSPIALLWLVLGYFQQGRELKLQVEELRRSVEQQKDLAQATRLEVEISRQLQLRHHEKEIRDAQPKFVIKADGHRGSPTVAIWFKLMNRGAHITNVVIEADSGRCDPCREAVMDNGGNFRVQVEVWPAQDKDVRLKISYLDALNHKNIQTFSLVRQAGGDYTVTPPILAPAGDA